MDIVAAPAGPVPLAPGSPLPVHNEHCFGCLPAERGGLGLRLWVAPDGGGIVGRYVVAPAHQGAPNIAHGGLLAVAMDELLGAVNWLLLQRAVTASLRIEFRTPVPVGSQLHLSAELVSHHGRKVSVAGRARLGEDGPVAVEAEGLFVQVPEEHFQRYAQGVDR